MFHPVASLEKNTMIASRKPSNSIKAVLATAFFVSAVSAQPAELPARPTINSVCETIPPFDDAAVRPFLEMTLVPGKRIDLAQIPPETMARLMALQKESKDRLATDWANLCRYSADNARVLASGKVPRVVFLGDSITEYWKQGDPTLFTDVQQDRGISGQTTAQIVLRFYPDVVALKPRVVHVMAGTNDIAGNLGQVSDDTIIANIAAMLDIAKANRISVVLASIPPARFMSWKPGLTPAPRIVALNQRLMQLAKARGAIYLDYHSHLKDDQGGFQATLSNDGVHPNRDAYAIMRPIAEKAIAQALGKKK